MDGEDGAWEPTDEASKKLEKKVKSKKKSTFKFFNNASESFKKSMFKLARRIINEECVLDWFNQTTATQIYKGKGSRQDISKSRFIPVMEDYLGDLCDSITVDDFKDDVFKTSSKFQIGGQKGMRAQFHLYVIKSKMQLIEEKGDVAIFTIVDIEKFSTNLNLMMGSWH